MTVHNVTRIIGAVVVTAALCSGSFAAVASSTYDYSHRRSKCTLKVPANATVHAQLVRNHFAFGASINRWSFDTLQKGVAGVTQNYGDVFLQYFDWGTPENEMKWEYVYKLDSLKAPPNWSRADYLVDFLQKNNITIRAHNLFWNEKKDWLPIWARKLNTTDFKAAMRERIGDAMPRYNGKVAHWDIINEIIHGENGSTPTTGTMLDSASGDPKIFEWILDSARTIDKTAKFVINDYNLVSGDQSPKYIAKCTPLISKFDIIGDEGHFGNAVFNKSTIDAKVKTLVDGLGGKKLWFTEVDWTFPESQGRADVKMEELMRTCFANKNIDGLIIWVWVNRNVWPKGTTKYSVMVDSLLVETPAGKKWRDVRAEWKTDTTVKADANGQAVFTGYQGRYRVVVNNDTQCVYLYPKDSVVILSDKKQCNCPVIADLPVSANVPQPRHTPHGITVNGTTLHGDFADVAGGRQLYLITYSLSGKQIAKIPLVAYNGNLKIPALPAGCHVYRICGAGQTIFTGMNMNLR